MRSLFVKIGSGFTILMLLLIGTFSLYFYTHNRRLLLDYARTALLYEIEQRVERFREDIDAAKKDVLFLSNAQPVQGIVRTIENDGADPLSAKDLDQWRGELASLFIQVIGKHQRYSQIRFIGGVDRYKEIVRVDRAEDGAPEVASVEMLQDKHHRDYVQETLHVPLGWVYSSKINLNREHHQISQPPTPTIRLATQVHYFGVPFGMVVINIDLRHDLADFSSPFPWKSRLYLTDEEGVYIAHPDPAKTFGSDLGHDANLRTETPLAWKTLNTLEPDAGRTLTGEMEVAGDAILFTGWFQVGGAWPQRRIGVTVEVEKSAIFGNLDRGYFYLLFAAPIAFCIGILMVWALSRRFAQPLADLSAAMTAYGRGEAISDPPVRSKDETGRIARSFAAMRERIDDRTNDLERLKNRLETLLDFVPVGIFETDARGDCLYVNKTWRALAGLTAEQTGGKGWMAALHPEDKEFVSTAWHKAVDENRNFNLQFRFQTPDGDVVWLLGSAIPNRNETGQIIGHFGVVQDITDLKAAEDALRESEARFRGVVETSPLCIVITDIHGTIEYVNPAFSGITGYGFEEAVGENPRILQSGRHDAAFYADLWQTIAAGKTWHGEMCNRKKNGELFWEQVAISPVKDEDGQVVNFVAVKQDISDRKNLERLKEDVDRIMRHDLKTPLNAIIGIPQILEMEDNLTEEQREYIGIIKTAGRRMVEMIDMSLDIYKMESGAYRCEPAPVDVKSVVRRILDETKSHASAKNVAIRFEENSGGRPVMVLAEKLLLLTMLSNLVINALEASPPDKSVVIATEALDEGLKIAVHNMGAVPEAVRKDFFQKYSTHGKKKGTGLGTYSAKLIAEAMNGRIRMDTSEETGTVVSVLLPKA